MAGAPISPRARSDAEDRLVEAEEPLAGMQLRSGGELPGTIATPALLELVRKARRFGLKLARARSRRRTSARSSPPGRSDARRGRGRRLRHRPRQLAGLAAPARGPVAAAQSRRAEIDRELAELTARLDPQQGVLSAEASSPELQQ